MTDPLVAGQTGIPDRPGATDDADGMWPSALRHRRWLDADGTAWQRRGDRTPLPRKRVEQLLRSVDTRVLLFYGPEQPSDVLPEERERLWTRVSPYLAAGAPAVNDHTSFEYGEFKDSSGRRLLVVEESC